MWKWRTYIEVCPWKVRWKVCQRRNQERLNGLSQHSSKRNGEWLRRKQRHRKFELEF
jgi:hypothetical protein